MSKLPKRARENLLEFPQRLGNASKEFEKVSSGIGHFGTSEGGVATTWVRVAKAT